MKSYMMILVMVPVMNQQKRKQIISFIHCHVKILKFLNFLFYSTTNDNSDTMETRSPNQQQQQQQQRKKTARF